MRASSEVRPTWVTSATSSTRSPTWIGLEERHRIDRGRGDGAAPRMPQRRGGAALVGQAEDDAAVDRAERVGLPGWVMIARLTREADAGLGGSWVRWAQLLPRWTTRLGRGPGAAQRLSYGRPPRSARAPDPISAREPGGR